MNLQWKTMTSPERKHGVNTSYHGPRVAENEQVKMLTRGHQSPVWPGIIALKKWRILYHTGIPEKGKSESWEKPRGQRNPPRGIWGIRTFKQCASYGLYVLARNQWTDYEEKELCRPLDNSFNLSSRGKACHFPWELWPPQLLIFCFLTRCSKKTPVPFLCLDMNNLYICYEHWMICCSLTT